MKTKTIRNILALLLFPAALPLGTGCESEKAVAVRDVQIEISPADVTLTRGESVEFQASGWDGYTWSLRYEDIGTLSHKNGRTTRYTNTGGSSTNQVLTVQARISGTNATQLSAQAVIRHK
jgi:hypothetical protein